MKLHGQPPSAVDRHIANARAASGTVYQALVKSTCELVRPPGGAVPPAANPAAAPSAPPAAPRGTPSRPGCSTTSTSSTSSGNRYSAWAITTSEGIILIDAIYDYSVEDEVVGGLTALGLDPKQIKYVVISHAHGDHVGGARGECAQAGRDAGEHQ